MKHFTGYGFQRIFSLGLIFSLLLASCSKNIDPVDPTPPNTPGFGIPAPSPLRADVSGQVVDENNIPVASATVTLGSGSYQTNADGFFNINGANLDKYVSTVTVQKTGYFKAFRSFSATTGRNYLSIKLLPKTYAGNVDAGSGGQVSLTNGTQIRFQPNGIILQSNGAAYTGQVRVAASYIDPTRPDIASVVPGSFMGQDASSMYILQSAGMIAVELETPTGEPLQLAAGKSANLRLPIPASLLGNAPASIDTWSLDARGVWKKEATAARNGDVYEFEASHFSFWNVDVPCQAVYLTLQVQTQTGQPLPNTLVRLRIPNNTTWWAATSGVTNSNGVVSGLVPANLGLEMTVQRGPFQCSNTLYTQNIGPFSSDTSLTVALPSSTSQVLTVTGTANGCNNQPLASGTAAIQLNTYSLQYVPVVNGTYSATFTFCQAPSSLHVSIIDSASQALGTSGQVSITGSSVSVPLITACGGSNAAVYTVVGCQANVTATINTALDTLDQILVTVNVTTPGLYNLQTDTINGMSFSAAGQLLTLGSNTVALTGHGTPVNSGTYMFQVQGPNQTGCSTTVVVGSGSPGNTAAFNILCNTIRASGTFTTGVPLSASNASLTLNVSVVSPGTFTINTGNSPVNGMSFSASGSFQNAGNQTVVLTGSGTPIAAGNLLLNVTGGGIICPYTVSVVSPGASSFTFLGAGANCQQPLIMGSYAAGVPTDSSNYVVLNVDVATAGSYSVSTQTVNGITFSGTGNLSQTGVRTVRLYASGTPVQAGGYAYQSASPNIIGTGCIFVINTN